MFVNLVSPSGTTLGQHRTRVFAPDACTQTCHMFWVCPWAVCCPRIPSAMVRWGKWGHDSPCSPFLPHYFFSHMQKWQRACTSSAETVFCPTAAARHRSNHSHFLLQQCNFSFGTELMLALSKHCHQVFGTYTPVAPTAL